MDRPSRGAAWRFSTHHDARQGTGPDATNKEGSLVARAVTALGRNRRTLRWIRRETCGVGVAVGQEAEGIGRLTATVSQHQTQLH